MIGDQDGVLLMPRQTHLLPRMLQAGVDTSVEYLDEYDVPAELVVAAELSAGGLLPLLSAPMSGQQRRDAWLAIRSTADKVK